MMKKEISWLLQEKYGGRQTPQFKKDVVRLQKGEPLAYLIGFVEFLGQRIDLSKKPLIPRPETEYWVREVIKELYNQKRAVRVLDMFAGSGCIGIALLGHLKNSVLVFADKEKKAIEQIKINCNTNAIDKKKYVIVQSDVFKEVTGKFDYIFANPPYIPITRKRKIQKSVLTYEPRAALFGGVDGLFYIKKFLAGARHFLQPGGKIYLEFDPPQKLAIAKLLKQYGYSQWEFGKDQYGRFRYASIDK